MPRVTAKEQYRRHIILCGLWTGFHEIFAVLPPAKQWAVHDYYHLIEQLSQEAFSTHAGAVVKKDISLSSEAGKGFLEIDRHFRIALKLADLTRRDISVCLREVIARAPKTYRGVVQRTELVAPAQLKKEPAKTTRNPKGLSRNNHGLVAVIRPNPNVQLLAHILLDMAKSMSR